MTDSVYLRVARAVDGDDWYMARLKMCAEIEEIPFSRQLAVLTTSGVAASIAVDTHGTVDTSGVTDLAMKNAMKTQWNKIKPTEPEPEPEEPEN